MIKSYPVVPKPYHRMTQRGKWDADAKRYTNWKADLQKLQFEVPDAGATLVFRMPIPKSWSKRKKEEMHGLAHQQKPDMDNLIKAAFDAARQYTANGDASIWHIAGACKVWWHEGAIEVITP